MWYQESIFLPRTPKSWINIGWGLVKLSRLNSPSAGKKQLPVLSSQRSKQNYTIVIMFETESRVLISRKQIQQLTIFRLIIYILFIFIVYDLFFVQSIDKKDLCIPRAANLLLLYYFASDSLFIVLQRCKHRLLNRLRSGQNGGQFTRHFVQWQLFWFDRNFTDVCFSGSNWQQVSLGSSDGLAPMMSLKTYWHI